MAQGMVELTGYPLAVHKVADMAGFGILRKME